MATLSGMCVEIYNRVACPCLLRHNAKLMNVSNPRNLPVIEMLLNPRLVQDYNALTAKLNLDSQCPFSSREISAIQWQLYFPHLVVAHKGNNETLNDLTSDFFQVAFSRMKTPVVVGDYVRAPMELREIRPYFGFRGLFGGITSKEMPLDELTTAVIKYKLTGLFTVYNMAAAATPLYLDPFGFTKDWRAMTSISEALALSVLISYWGRESTPLDQPVIKYIGDIIYETWCEVDRIVSEAASE